MINILNSKYNDVAYDISLNLENTEEHGKNVSKISLLLAKELKIDPINSRIIACAAKYHDLGKKYIAPEIINKIGELNKEERKEIEKHAKIGANIMKTSVYLKPYSNFVLMHHENYDGTGYNKVKGKNIPLESRIIRVADYFDALCQARPYRPALTQKEALEVMENDKESFDPYIFEVFVNLVQKGAQVK